MEFETSGMKITVENGIIRGIPGKEINGLEAGEIVELSNVPRPMKALVKENSAKLKGKIYYGGMFMPREIAEEAIRQADEIRAANNPENRIEGLREIKRAIALEERYQFAFEKMMEDPSNDGANPPEKPEISSEELKKKYPRAAAYLKADDEGWIGIDFAKRILDGEDHEVIMQEMKEAIEEHVDDLIRRGE
jgi:predicted RNase H-like HicB family nuclease